MPSLNLLPDERHRIIRKRLSLGERVLALEMAGNSELLRTPSVVICANWRVSVYVNASTEAPCQSHRRPVHLGYARDKSSDRRSLWDKRQRRLSRRIRSYSWM